MKSLLIFSILVVVTAAQQLNQPLPSSIVEAFKQQIAPYVEECFVESGAKPELLDRLVLYREYPDDKPLKCFLKCQMLKTNLMNVKGDVKVENIIQMFRVSKQTVEKCSQEKGRDLCDRAYSVSTCLYTLFTDAGVTPSPTSSVAP